MSCVLPRQALKMYEVREQDLGHPVRCRYWVLEGLQADWLRRDDPEKDCQGWDRSLQGRTAGADAVAAGRCQGDH